MRALLLLLAGCQAILGLPEEVNVACDVDNDCDPDAPRCERASGKCLECLTNAQCPSNMCLPNGACVQGDEVLFATDVTAATECTMPQPCQIDEAIRQATPTKHVIQLVSQSGYFIPATLVVDKQVVIFGPEPVTSLFASSNITPYFDVQAAGDLTISRLILRDAAGVAIQCSRGRVTVANAAFNLDTIGIQADDCELEVTDSLFSGNPMMPPVAIGATAGTLVLARTSFTSTLGVSAGYAEVEACAFSGGGGGQAEFATIRLESGFVFHSTFVNNLSSPGFGHTIDCGNALIDSSVVFNNPGGPPFTNNCTATYTIGTDAPGEGNQNVDPMFDSMSIRLAPDSPGVGAANPDRRRSRDFTGAVRPAPDGSIGDCGAFENP